MNTHNKKPYASTGYEPGQRIESIAHFDQSAGQQRDATPRKREGGENREKEVKTVKRRW